MKERKKSKAYIEEPRTEIILPIIIRRFFKTSWKYFVVYCAVIIAAEIAGNFIASPWNLVIKIPFLLGGFIIGAFAIILYIEGKAR